MTSGSTGSRACLTRTASLAASSVAALMIVAGTGAALAQPPTPRPPGSPQGQPQGQPQGGPPTIQTPGSPQGQPQAQPPGQSQQGCASFNCGSQRRLNVRQGPNFHHVLPAGWTVTEEGQHALSLRSRDASAGIVNFGLSGLLQPLTPQQLTHELMVNRLRLATNLRFLDMATIRPLPPYAQAAIMGVAYTSGGQQFRGYVVANVANVYNRTDGMITLVAAKDRVWPAYADWLPPLALMVINTGPDPYGRHSTSQMILNDTRRLNQLASEYRDWSQRTWADVAQFRARIEQRQQQELGPTLTGQQWYNNPYGGPQIRQSSAPAVIWINANGDMLPSDNASFDPRTPSDQDWQRLVR